MRVRLINKFCFIIISRCRGDKNEQLQPIRYKPANNKRFVFQANRSSKQKSFGRIIINLKGDIMEKQKFKEFEEEKFEDQDIYTEEGIEEYSEDDVISPFEEGFMLGYLAS